jgi:hypothetical protein
VVLIRIPVSALGTTIAALVPPSRGAEIEMDLVIGPLLERNGGYSYDTFSLAEGLRSSFRYLRLDAARYDQRALMAEARRDPRCRVLLCETQSDFEESVAAARRGSKTTDEAQEHD